MLPPDDSLGSLFLFRRASSQGCTKIGGKVLRTIVDAYKSDERKDSEWANTVACPWQTKEFNVFSYPLVYRHLSFWEVWTSLTYFESIFRSQQVFDLAGCLLAKFAGKLDAAWIPNALLIFSPQLAALSSFIMVFVPYWTLECQVSDHRWLYFAYLCLLLASRQN